MSRSRPDADARTTSLRAAGSSSRPLFACILLLSIALQVAGAAAPVSRASGTNECPVSTPSGGICINGENIVLSARDDSWSLENVRLRDVRGTRVAATRARGIERGGLIEIDFAGQVHVEFRGALLDADTAHVVLRDESLISVDVRGSQAKFSHQLERSKRRVEGMADNISYVAATGIVQFRGNTFYTNGVNTMRTPELTYNINTQEARAPNSTGTIRLGDRDKDKDQAQDQAQSGERVPPPRIPERNSAQ